MITIIEGTNRTGSMTSKVAHICSSILTQNTQEEIAHFKLSDLDDFVIHGDMYQADNQSLSVRRAQDKYIKPADKWVVVLPEYNGGIPGIFKLFIDAISVRDKKENFLDKKVCLIGVASGRAGNLRGLDDISNYFHYLGMNVFPTKLPISLIETILSEDELMPIVKDSLIELLGAFKQY